MENSDVCIGISCLLLIFALILGCPYGMYRYGRMAERRSLYEALTSSIEATYNDGLQDGLSRGYKKGWREALANCKEEPEEDGRY